MEKVADRIHIPIATGERLHTLEEFGMLLSRNACQYIRPDVCLCGGITQAKKITAWRKPGEFWWCPITPESGQYGGLYPAGGIQKLCDSGISLGEDSAPKNEIVKSTLTLKDGCLTVPEGPGIGIELNESAMNKYPYKPRLYVTKLREDGAVADQ